MNTDFAGTRRNAVDDWHHDIWGANEKGGESPWHKSAISKLARNKNGSGGWVSWPSDCIMLLGPRGFVGVGVESSDSRADSRGKGLYVRTLHGESQARNIFRAV